MSCVTAACNGYVTCQQELNCKTARCLQEYIPPANLPQSITTDENTLALFSIGSGTALSPMEIGISNTMNNTEERILVGGVPWVGSGPLTTKLYFMNARYSDKRVLQNQKVLYYGNGDRNPIMIFYQDPKEFIWYIWSCEKGDMFSNTGREYIKMIPMLIEAIPGDGIWILNRGERLPDIPAVFTADPEPTLISFSYMFYAWSVNNPTQSPFTTLLFGENLAFQSVSCIDVSPECNADPFNCNENSWLIKGNEQLFGNDFCIAGEPILLAHKRTEIPKVEGAQIGDGTGPGFCKNINCVTKCSMSYFMVTESNGCLPPLIDSGSDEANDNSVRNMWIVIGILLGAIFVLLIIWLIVLARARK